jgi:hypothetical protein
VAEDLFGGRFAAPAREGGIDLEEFPVDLRQETVAAGEQARFEALAVFGYPAFDHLFFIGKRIAFLFEGEDVFVLLQGANGFGDVIQAAAGSFGYIPIGFLKQFGSRNRWNSSCMEALVNRCLRRGEKLLFFPSMSRKTVSVWMQALPPLSM